MVVWFRFLFCDLNLPLVLVGSHGQWWDLQGTPGPGPVPGLLRIPTTVVFCDVRGH